MSADEYRAKLMDIPMLESLDSNLRESLCEILSSIAAVETLDSGDVLYERDAEDANTGAILLEGVLEIKGDGAHVLDISAPNLLGEMQQFNDYGQRTATVIAKTDVSVIQFAWHDFVTAMVAMPDISIEQQAEVRELLASVAGSRLDELSG